MPGYSGTPLWKKLGYKAGATAHVAGAPQSYESALELPKDIAVRWAKLPHAGISFVHLFATSKTELAAKLKTLRQTIAPDGAVWISWPKKSSGVVTDITEDTVRAVALPLGFVDIKVCAVDDTWSGLKLVIRKALR